MTHQKEKTIPGGTGPTVSNNIQEEIIFGPAKSVPKDTLQAVRMEHAIGPLFNPSGPKKMLINEA